MRLGSRTHDLIIRPAGIIRPRRPLHDPPRHGLEIHQIITRLQRRHHLYPFQSCLLLRVFHLLYLRHRTHIYLPEMFRFIQILVERIGGVDRLEFFRGIFTGIFEDDLGAARVFCIVY